MNKVIDLTGQRFGKLVVIQRISRPNSAKRKSAWWECKCDCGNKELKITHTSALMSGETKSCGCLLSENGKKRSSERIKKFDPYESSLNFIYNAYKKGAIDRDIDFNLSKLELEEIIFQNCFYCGIKPFKNISERNKRRNFRTDFKYNGIDRLDSSQEYSKSNVVPCCFRCNQSKNDMTVSDFLLWIERVYNHSIINKQI